MTEIETETPVVTLDQLIEVDRLEAEADAALAVRADADRRRNAALHARNDIVNEIATRGPFVVGSNHTARGQHRYVCIDSRSGKPLAWQDGTIQRKPAENDALTRNRRWAGEQLDALRKLRDGA